MTTSTPFVLTDADVVINGTNVSVGVHQVELSVTFEDKDTTAMGATAKTRLGGLADGSVKISFYQSFAASEMDSILWPLRGTVVTCNIKAKSSANSTTNPQYQGNVLINQLVPISGTVGDVAVEAITWPSSGPWVRATS